LLTSEVFSSLNDPTVPCTYQHREVVQLKDIIGDSRVLQAVCTSHDRLETEGEARLRPPTGSKPGEPPRVARDDPRVPPRARGWPGDPSPEAGGTCEGDAYPEAGQAGELAVERGEAVVTHGEVFLQGSPSQQREGLHGAAVGPWHQTGGSSTPGESGACGGMG